MFIELKSELFSNIENLQDINQLLSIFSDNRRYDYFCDITEIQDTIVFRSLLEIDRETIKEYYNLGVTESKKSTHTIAINSSEEYFNLIEAKRFFNQPLIILLENDFNDSHFVDSIINVFSISGQRIQESFEYGWWQYGNGGGCTNFINTIKSRLDQYKHLPKENYKYFRCYVLIDSDKKYPDETIRIEKTRIIDFLNENKISYHLLEKREIENYLPDEMYKKIDGCSEYIGAYLSLSPVQKDYFDIEKGFKDKNRNQLDENVAELYKNISEDTYKIFRKKKMEIGNFKSEFPKLFKGVTKEQFIQRTSHQSNPSEIEEIVKSISELL